MIDYTLPNEDSSPYDPFQPIHMDWNEWEYPMYSTPLRTYTIITRSENKPDHKKTKKELISDLEHERDCRASWERDCKRLQRTIEELQHLDHRKWVGETLPFFIQAMEERDKLKEDIRLLRLGVIS